MNEEKQLETVETNYLEQIEELKKQMEQMVPGDAYNKVLEEHKKLTNEYINKRPAPVKQESKHRDVKEIINDINKPQSNKDYIKNVLEYREAILTQTGVDVFSDISTTGPGEPTPETHEVASALEALLEEANSPAEFNYLLDQTLSDDAQLTAMLKAKRNRK